MNKKEFLLNQNVAEFISWGTQFLPGLTIRLRISKKGTGSALGHAGPGVDKKICRFSDLIRAYHWRSEWRNADGVNVFSDDWSSSSKSLAELSGWLRAEVAKGSHIGTLQAAKAIVIWGGDRAHLKTPPKGAIPFLEGVGKDLPTYLEESRSALTLRTADNENAGKILQMNAMLTKVHALLADDGLPIYDSRVAGAISSLVEKYRQSQGLVWTRVPSVLQFKATDRTNVKRLASRVPGALPKLDYGVINRLNPNGCVSDWVSAKIRLGWLMKELILKADNQQNPIVDPAVTIDKSLPSRMRAFEAGLFMLGFDVACLFNDQ